jgi:ribonuclease BN (tRNA processing enzyme)
MSIAGEQYRRYGGNTTCYHVEVEPGHHLVVDCGTGLRTLQHDVSKRGPQRFSVFFTHYHWDHVQGLPVFMPLFQPGNQIVFHGPAGADMTVEQALRSVIRPPWFPVTLDEAAADIGFRTMDGSVAVGETRVTAAAGTHPQGVLAYRIDGAARSATIVTDHESGDPEVDAAVARLATDTDVLVHDAQYTPEELQDDRKGWGHSSYEGAVHAARASGAGRLVLTSHDPDRTDSGVDALRGSARGLFPHTDAAYEGMTIPL